VGLIAAITAGLVVWIALFALNVKSFDAFMITVAVAVAAVTVRLFKPYVDQFLGRVPPPGVGS
jgi:hypothetical protein